MNAAAISAVPSDIGVQSTVSPAASTSARRFSDLLATNTSSLASFALLIPAGSDNLGSTAAPPARKSDPNADGTGVMVPIALPTPVQSPPPATTGGAGSENASGASSGGKQPAATDATGTQQAIGGASATAAASSGSAGTSGTSNGSAQAARGTALPPIAADLGARVAVAAQSLVSQPSQALASLPHAALAATPNSLDTPPSTSSTTPTATPHGTLAPDPGALLAKLTPSAAASAATPAPLAAFETAAQSVAPQTAAVTAATAALATAGNAAAQLDATPSTSAQTPPVLVPLPASISTPSAETATLPTVAASALDQVAFSLKQGLKTGLNQIEIQLKPASLGAIDIKLELSHDGRVTAVISADRSDTLMQLQRGSGELQQALKDAGLQTDNGSLSFNLRGDAQTNDQSGRQSGYAATLPGIALADDLAASQIAAAATATQPSHVGLLNIQV